MKVLFLDTVHPILKERLELAGYECIESTSARREEVMDRAREINGLVIRSRLSLDRKFLEAMPDLKFIARSGSGLENIDTKAAEELGIEIFNSPEGNRDAVAEQVIGMLLMLFNNLKRADSEVRKGQWRREANRGIELCGKTFGIIGYGVMGRALAQRLSGFGVKILAYDKYLSGFGDDNVQEVELEELLQKIDILSFHVPLTEETRHYFNDSLTSRLGRPIHVINSSRGPVVNTEHLAECLDTGLVKGACLDVLEYEKKSFEKLDFENLPPAMNYLIQSDKVILSPHIAGWTEESYEKLSSFLADKILAKFGKCD